MKFSVSKVICYFEVANLYGLKIPKMYKQEKVK